MGFFLLNKVRAACLVQLVRKGYVASATRSRDELQVAFATALIDGCPGKQNNRHNLEHILHNLVIEVRNNAVCKAQHVKSLCHSFSIRFKWSATKKSLNIE